MGDLTRRQFIGGALGTCALAACSRPHASPPTGTNVLIVVLDTVRFDRFVADGGRRTPALHALAARGVSFSNAWAASSWSLPSHASILTGAYPHEHGADWPDLALRPETRTMAEVLAERGYVTGAFSSNSAWVTPEYLGRGFVRFDVYSLEDHIRRTTQGRIFKRPAELLGLHAAGRGRKAPAVNRDFLSFLDAYPDRPFFGYLCHMDVNQAFHHTQLNRPYWAGRASVPEVLGSYDDALAEVDRRVAELMHELERRDRLRNTIVVVTSDHGESFGTANAGDHDPAGHGTSLFPEQTRVFLVVAGPGVPAGQAAPVQRPVTNSAVPATVYRLLGLPSPWPGEPLPVRSEWAVDPDPAALIRLRYDKYREDALATTRWYYRRDLVKSQDEVYDIVADPTARAPLGAVPELAILRSKCDAMLRERIPTAGGRPRTFE